MKLKYMLVVLAALLYVNSSYADPGMTRYAKQYLNKFALIHKPIFYSACKEPKDIAVLVFGFGEKRGLLMEVRDNDVANLAKIEIKNGVPTLVETEGGVYSYRRVGDLLNKMVKLPFYLGTKSLAEIIRQEINITCQ